MKQPLTFDAISETLKFPFQDTNWKQKLITAFLLSLVAFPFLVPGLFLTGYFYRIMHRIIVEGGKPYLPEWDDWGGLLKDGFQLWAATLIIFLPLLLIFIASFLAMFLPFISLSNSPESEISAFSALWLVISPLLMGCAGLPAFIVGIISPAAICHVVDKNSIRAVFQFREWWAIFRANISGFIVSFILYIGLTFIASFIVQFLMLTVIFICLYPFALMAYSTYLGLIAQTLYSQAYVIGKGRVSMQTHTSDTPAIP